MPYWKVGFDFLKLPKFLARPQPNLSGKIFPSGRFTLGSTPKKSLVPDSASEERNAKAEMCGLSPKDFFYCPYGEFSGSALSELQGVRSEEIPQIGSSKAAISRKRGKRGCRGISSRAADQLGYWVSQLESRYGKDCLSFLTLTVPDFQGTLRQDLQREWSGIVKRFLEELKRLLSRKGIENPAIFGCTEIQEKRSKRDGWNVPHLHLVFRGRKGKKNPWVVVPAAIRRVWKRVVCARLDASSYDFGATENLQRIKYSAARYLSKYISKQRTKGAFDSTHDTWHPSEYVVCGRRFRREFARLSIRGSSVAQYILECIRQHTLLKGWWMHPITVKTSIGDQVMGYVGRCDEWTQPPDPNIWLSCG